MAGNPVLRAVSYYYRRYYGKSDEKFDRDKYPFPIDAEELDDLDLAHHFLREACRGSLFSSPLDPNDGLRVLDLGTGTGIWPVELAEEYPNIVVQGVDFNRIQPLRIPRNMLLLELDIEQDWDAIGHGWDLIHVRTMLGSIHNWKDLYCRAFKHLKPLGYLEHVEIDWVPRSHGRPLIGTALDVWADAILTAMDKRGRSMRVDPARTRHQLWAAGFTDITESATRICFSGWSGDVHEEMVARYFNGWFKRRLPAMSYRPLMETCGMTKEFVQHLCEGAYEVSRTLHYEAYCLLYVWIARKA
ncbi:hypothetical protein JDV02_003128 [Purpureocillium takamizusanense]|uniref:S-adenosyl-L-methionine-dependent methyltransferase n=1 Tax=Purpureocillium takamizusanense TaxID=2060973 RepID=A0A9Q8V854_9HYPO|nr:uncharacterized protein JDV02_003128 [Purpureocillium takamizusanense]UNI16715.1 hypothetical protein JDV02_003128 [Purpureocillium takamizusanense]